MKRKINILLLFLLFVVSAKAQEEKGITLFTDRDLYISGETLLLKVFVPSTEESGTISIDLINNAGKKITGIIKEVKNQEADGFILLPDSCSSGYYLIRSSTIVGNVITIKEIYISNRFNGLPPTNSGLHPTGIVPFNEIISSEIQVNHIEKQYKPRDKVKADLRITDDLLGKVEGDLLVKIAEVIPDFQTSTFNLKTSGVKTGTVNHQGILLEGTVTELRSAKPYKNAVVYLSIPDSLPGFQYFITGENGRFYFQIENYYGRIPVVIQCHAIGQPQLLKISLNDPDSLKWVMPDFEPQPLPVGLRKRVERNTDAITFRKVFNQKEVTEQPSPIVKRDTYPFYGNPAKTVDPQLFVDLPDFSDISRELLPGVKFRTYNRIPSLQVLNMPMFKYFEDAPLVLFDGIPTEDLNMIKSLGSADIDKIEIINSERFFGDLSFQGVVAIYSSKADYSKIPESDNLIKLNLDVIQPQVILNNTDSQSESEPDFRQVLLWKPSVKPAQTIPVEFQTSDIQGTFKLSICGKTKDGSDFYKEQIFEVN